MYAGGSGERDLPYCNIDETMFLAERCFLETIACIPSYKCLVCSAVHLIQGN